MWKQKRDALCFVLVATLTAITLVSAGVVLEESGKPCASTDVMNQCGKTRRCELDEHTKKYVCKCLVNFIQESPGGECVPRPTTTVPPRPETTTEKLSDKPESSGSSVAVGLLVPTFLIVLGVLGFCAARRYGLLPCRRNLYGNVLVTRDDDDDDPPIA